MGDGVTFSEELVSSLLDAGLRDLVGDVESGNGSVGSVSGGAREGEHEAFGDVVEFAVGLEGNGLPLIGAVNPVSHVVDGGVSGGSSGGELSELNDLGSSLLDSGGELVSDPVSGNKVHGVLAVDDGVSDIGVHGGRVVSPDGHLLDGGGHVTGLEGELSEGSVVVESGHGGEVGNGNIGSVALADESVGVGGVSDNNGLDVTRGVVVDGLTDINEDLAVVLEEIGTLHSGASGLGSNEEVVVNVLEGGGEVGGDDDFVEEGEGTIVELGLDTLEDLFLEGEVEEVENDSLVFAEELATGNSVDDGVGDLSGGSGDEDSLGRETVVGGESTLGGGEVHSSEGLGDEIGRAHV